MLEIVKIFEVTQLDFIAFIDSVFLSTLLFNNADTWHHKLLVLVIFLNVTMIVSNETEISFFLFCFAWLVR